MRSTYRSSTTPLTEELDHGREVQTVQVTLVQEHLLQLAKNTNTLGGLKLMLMGSLDGGDVVCDVVAVGVLFSDFSQDLCSLLDLALLDKETRRFKLEKCQDEGNSRKHDVQAGGDKPLVVAVAVDVDVGAVVGEVGEHDANIHRSSEETRAKTTNRSRCNFSDIHRPNRRSKVSENDSRGQIFQWEHTQRRVFVQHLDRR